MLPSLSNVGIQIHALLDVEYLLKRKIGFEVEKDLER